MKIARIALCALVASSAFASVASADARLPRDEITFSYMLSRDRVADSPAEVYADLVAKARLACAIPGKPGLPMVDAACASELVEKVVIAANSTALRAAHEGAFSSASVQSLPVDLLAAR